MSEETDRQVETIEGIDLREWLKDRIRATPWWALSIGFHAVLLAALGLVQLAAVKLKDHSDVIVISSHFDKKKVATEGPREILSRTESLDRIDSSEDPSIVKDSRLAEHTETDNDKTTREVSAPEESERTNINDLVGEAGLGRDPRKRNTGSTGITGLGGGAGRPSGSYGPRGRGGNENCRVGGGLKTTESSVEAGLRWLARHQAADGAWRAETYAHTCAPGTPCAGQGYTQFDAGVTGLSLLAFLGAGFTHYSREVYDDPYTQRRIHVGQVVRRAQKFLVDQQDQDGCVGSRTGEFMYNHAIATLALVEAYGMTNASALRRPAERAIAFLVSAQNPYRGWRYSVQPGDNDTSVTGWCVMALKSAHVSGLPIPHTSFDGARAWIDSVTDEAGIVGYTGKGKVGVVIPGKNDAWKDHPAMTAVGLLCRIFIDRNPGDGALEKLARNVSADLPRWDAAPSRDRPVDFYYWYYGALALYQYDAPGGRHWKSWNEAMKTALVPTQARSSEGCADGSWDPAVDRWGAVGGRVYATAINTLSLEVYYRYAKVSEAGTGKRGVSVGG